MVGSYQLFWHKLEEIGWLASLNDDKLPEVSKKIERRWKRKPRWAHLALATGKYNGYQLEEYGLEEGGKERIEKALAAYQGASLDRYQLEQLEVSYWKRYGVLWIKFLLNKTHCFREIPLYSGSLAEELHVAINEGLEKAGFTERFYILPGHDNWVRLVIVEPAVWRRAIAEDLIPDPGRILDFEDMGIDPSDVR